MIFSSWGHPGTSRFLGFLEQWYDLTKNTDPAGSGQGRGPGVCLDSLWLQKLFAKQNENRGSGTAVGICVRARLSWKMKQVSRPYKHSIVFTAHIKQGWLLCWDWIISKVTYSPKILKPSHRSIISTHVCGSEGTFELLSTSFLGDRMKRNREKQGPYWPPGSISAVLFDWPVINVTAIIDGFAVCIPVAPCTSK